MPLQPGCENGEKSHILVVDDEPGIRLTLRGALKPFYHVTAVGSGEEALDLASESDFDLVLLDLYLPGMNGLETLRKLKRRHPRVVIIMLTGQASVDSAVYAMRHGALHYLQKPASNAQILESVREGLDHAEREQEREAVLHKARQFLQAGLQELGTLVEDEDAGEETGDQAPAVDEERFLQRGPLTLDVYRRQASLDDEWLDLTAGEYDLLLCLAQHAPQVLSPQTLVQETRGYECSLSEARELIRWQIYLLRQKVEPDPSSPQYILNVRGRGYMWAGG
jgi:DNA-binding response OmpR family regulator